MIGAASVICVVGDMEPQLTNFQVACEKRLIAALAVAGRGIVGRRLDGVSQTYITGTVEGRDLTFWIYTDGADFHGTHLHRIFEWQDYDSLDDLASDFVAQLTSAAA